METITEKVSIYIAGDCFTYASKMLSEIIERTLQDLIREMIITNIDTGNNIKTELDIYNPSTAMMNDKSLGYTSGQDILMFDYDKLIKSDIVIFIGDYNDAGALAEVGIAWQAGIPIFSLYTDSRLSGIEVKEKHEALQKDVFQGDFMYVNKLVSSLSRINKYGKEYGIDHEIIEKPLLFTDPESLVSNVIVYAVTGKVPSDE